MEAQKVDMFIMSNGKFFESHQINVIRERLIALDDSKWAMISTIQFKDPTTSLIVSILAGSLGHRTWNWKTFNLWRLRYLGYC